MLQGHPEVIDSKLNGQHQRINRLMEEKEDEFVADFSTWVEQKFATQAASTTVSAANRLPSIPSTVIWVSQVICSSCKHTSSSQAQPRVYIQYHQEPNCPQQPYHLGG